MSMSLNPRLQLSLLVVLALAAAGCNESTTENPIAAADHSVIDLGTTDENQDHGCTPGYWKNQPEAWARSGYSPRNGFNDVFGCRLFDDGVTLMDALWFDGGKHYRLGRHGVAALLNAAHPHVNYALSVGGVLAAVCTDRAAGLLEALNESLCPLDAHGGIENDEDEDDEEAEDEEEEEDDTDD